VRERGLTLLTSDEGAWQAWTDAERPATPLPLTTRHVSMAGDPAQASATAALLEVGPRGAVVVRPDMHVVWRSSDGPDRAGSELARFLQGAWAPLWDDVVSARPSS
jgi:2,4-dichlorophenol 6-monooxygenase